MRHRLVATGGNRRAGSAGAVRSIDGLCCSRAVEFHRCAALPVDG
ncbi:hypothetical protein [Microbulbifer halophilus]